MTNCSRKNLRSQNWRQHTLRLCLLGLVSLASCQPNSESELDSASTGKTVLTTFTVLADMTQNVAGDEVMVASITKRGAEIHGYEPTPSDLERGQQAALILDNGLGLERWAQDFYGNFPVVPHITLSKGIQPMDITSDAYRGKPNPHAWMSPQNALVYVDNIRDALSELDPENADLYAANATAYQAEIEALDRQLKTAIAKVPAAQRFLVSCEGAFSYLARDYGLQEIYIWPVNAEKQATPKQIERVIDTVRENQIPTVFCESTVSDEAQRQVAQESGAQFGGVFYVDSLSPPDGPATTYLELLAHNVNTLIQGLLPPASE
ncbi:MAG: metal ABC transporter substrate-binding protein [Cyanobacteria bacterium P01_H01_bin.15]